MSWRDLIQANTAVWHGVEGYVDERIAQLIGVCTAIESTEAEIRAAQASISELRRLAALPKHIQAETQVRARGARKEY